MDRDEAHRERDRVANPDPHDVPGFDRATGIDDPIPDAEYGAIQPDDRPAPRDVQRRDEGDGPADIGELEREGCRRCGGSGQITKSVAGRSGLVPCPGCENVPDYAVLDEIPEDPEGRIEEIEAEIGALDREKEAVADLRSGVLGAKDRLLSAANDDLVGDETSIKLAFLATQVIRVLETMQDDRHYSYQREQLGREKAKLRTYLDHLEDGNNA
ncbi:hypothetical protein [Saliphagus sp. LR7]|uniref:hypothetical protein n=1 Tax=Saliphagus sp. LR7 TaxID=2282654 RepID=UPI000DF82B70|nr:hypothetical protein [Saliphagus sp. LR7]